MAMDKYIGRLLDNRYEILDIIGNGGMAVVYKARCHRLNRLVAIKILKDEYSQDQEFRRRFHAESQAVAMLNHPNIVSVYDVSTNGDADYIVMELVEGITLKQYMEKRGGSLNWKEALHFAMQIAKALEHAHNQGIVHRDIKPHNVMILKNGTAKVTDFGIARVMSSQSTLTREALGSVHYISPEQAKGGRVDNRSDLYSLGVVMYEMLTGQPPYDGESPVAVALQHINGGAKMPSTLNPNIPGGLEQIIMHAMAVDPAQRYASASEMLYDLEEFRKNPNILFFFEASAAAPRMTADRPRVPVQGARSAAERTANRASAQSPSRPREAVRPAGASRPAPSPRPAPEPEEPERNKTLTIAIVACAALAVVAIVVLGVLLLQGGGKSMVEVPNFVGQVYKEIDQRLYPKFQLMDEDYQFSDEFAAGEIMDQDPAAHTNVEEGATVKFIISNGPQTSEMKDLVNRTKEKVESYINIDMADMDLSLVYEEEYSDEIEAGRVIRTDPEADEMLTVGQQVTVVLSKGPLTMVMDDLTGRPRDSAELHLKNLKDPKSLKDMNLDVRVMEENSEDVEAGRVIRTDPEKGKTIQAGQTVTVYVSKGKAVVMTTVPQVEGLDITKAVSMLNDKKLEYDYEMVDSDRPKDEVLTQSEKKGTQVPEGTVIKLTVSKGPVETKPTQPAEISKLVYLQLPADIAVSYKIQVYQNGKPCTDAYTVSVGTVEVPMSLSGSGVQYFDFYVNGKYQDSFKVDFSTNAAERVELKFTVDG